MSKELFDQVFYLIGGVIILFLNIKGYRNGKRIIKHEDAPEETRNWILKHEKKINRNIRLVAIITGIFLVVTSLIFIVILL